MTPLADLRSVGVTHLSYVVVISSSMMPAACAIIGTVPPQANTRMSGVLQHRPSSRAACRCPSRARSRRVVRVVQQFGCPHLADLRAQAHQRHREQVVGEAGVDAGGEARRLAQLAGLGDGFDPVRRVEVHRRPHPRRHGRRADVDPRAQEPGDQGDVVVGVRGGGPVVHQRVGFERDERVDVVGGRHAQASAEAADLTDVAAHLVGIAHPDPDQLEQRVLDDLGDDHPSRRSPCPR